MDFTRARFDEENSGKDSKPREHTNEITSVIDGSVVYGSDETRAKALRSFRGGRLRILRPVGRGSLELPPLNTRRLENEGGSMRKDLFLVGDVRGNEQIVLTALHTLFLREHNRLCALIAKKYQKARDEEIYQLARKIVGMEIQKITYDEWLPLLLGMCFPPLYITRVLSSHSSRRSLVTQAKRIQRISV